MTSSLTFIAHFFFYSNVSGIGLLGVPAEIFNYGTTFALIALFAIPGMLIIMYWFMPMFYELQFTSSYEVSSVSDLDPDSALKVFI